MAADDIATPNAIERKKRSIAKLKAEGVPVIEHLPAIEDETQAQRRSVEAVAYRAMALLVVAIKGEGLEQSLVDGVVEKYELVAHFTAKERAFLNDPDPTQHDRVQFTWRYEAACTLLWALGYIEELNKPTSICDPAQAVTIMHSRSGERFVAEAKLRSHSEILDHADLTYRYHWAIRDAQINGRPAPADLEAGVTLERHYALNWLIGYMDQEWDDIGTDT